MIVKNSKTAKKRLVARSRNGSRRYEISVRKTNSHFYAFVYDTELKNIVFSKSTLAIKSLKNTSNKDSATAVGSEVLAELKSRNIDSVFFNKLTYKYHGKLISFLEPIRNGGIAI